LSDFFDNFPLRIKRINTKLLISIRRGKAISVKEKYFTAKNVEAGLISPVI
jgi:hypothetical protein